MDSLSDNVCQRPPFASDCTVCQAIWQAFTHPDTQHEVDFGSFEEALSTKCLTHKPLIQAFTGIRGKKYRWPWSKTQDMGLRGLGNGSASIVETLGDNGGWAYTVMPTILVNKSSADHPGYGRIMNPDWVDLGLLKIGRAHV